MLRSRLALGIVCFLLGVGLVAQFRARRERFPASNVPSQDSAVVMGGLVVTNGELRSEVQKLQGEILAYQRASERIVVPQMAEELGRMRIVTGHSEVTGAGVQIVVGQGVSVIDLQDLLNEIRNIGAEAVALGGQRVTISTGLTADEQGILVGGQRIEPPYVFQAIGDPTTMVTALNRRGGVLEMLRVAYPGLTLQVSSEQLLVLPAVRDAGHFVLAQPVE